MNRLLNSICDIIRIIHIRSDFYIYNKDMDDVEYFIKRNELFLALLVTRRSISVINKRIYISKTKPWLISDIKLFRRIMNEKKHLLLTLHTMISAYIAGLRLAEDNSWDLYASGYVRWEIELQMPLEVDSDYMREHRPLYVF